MKGEKGSAYYNAIDPWIHEWLSLLHTRYVLTHNKTLNLVINIIVNFDECGFQYKSLPQYSYIGKKEEIRAKKPLLGRITGLFGSSANARKFKPVIIGKAAYPRAFNNLRDLSELPVHYYHSANAWMTGEIFRDWFLNSFLLEMLPIVDPDMRIQFLVDNCSAHADTELEFMDPNVTIKYLPANTTSLIQPMDQAVLACVKSFQKRNFYHKLVQYCEEHYDQPEAFKAYLKQYTILEAIKDISEGWNQVSDSTIRKAFRKVFPTENGMS